MIVQTRNTRYTLVPAGRGLFMISGHARYCPTPTRVRLLDSVQVGQPMFFGYVDAKPAGVQGRAVLTSTVQQVTP